MITIDNKYKLGSTAYLKTDPEQLERMAYGLEIAIDGTYFYKLVQGINCTSHHELEITTTKKQVEKWQQSE